MNREKQLRYQLHKLRVEYQEKAQPLIDELVKIECAKPPRRHIVAFNEALLRLPDGPITDAFGYLTSLARKGELAGEKPEREQLLRDRGVA